MSSRPRWSLGRKDLGPLAAGLLILAVTLPGSADPAPRSVNWLPFADLISSLRYEEPLVAYAFANVVGNVMLFAPLGFTARHRLDRPGVIRFAAVTAAISASIELTQLGLGQGRVADTTDVVCNVAGGVSGFLLGGLVVRGQKPPRPATAHTSRDVAGEEGFEASIS